jgi:uncharacterized protein (DUF2225 family)
MLGRSRSPLRRSTCCLVGVAKDARVSQQWLCADPSLLKFKDRARDPVDNIVIRRDYALPIRLVFLRSLNMTEMEPIELTCPNCSTEFNSETLMSTNSFGGIQTDFRKLANGYQPRQFLIHRCPSCGFSGFDKDFKPIRGSLSTSVSKLVKEQLTPSMRGARPTTWRKFEYAARISIRMNKPAAETASHFLMAAYSCADEGASQEEIYYRTRAIEFFGKALDGGDVAIEHMPQITYLVGELYRRIGRQTEAAEWFERAEVSPSSTGC